MGKISVLLVDDHALMRMGIRSLVELQPDMEIVGECDDGASAIQVAQDLKPDVIIMDLMMPSLGGADATKSIKSILPPTKIIILSSFGTSVEMTRAISFGADGAVLKESPITELLASIRTVAAGGMAIDKQIELVAQSSPCPTFTPRQEAVIDSITRGLSNDDIAIQLGISKSRVKQHLNEIYEKLGAANRAEAVAIALRKHLLKT